MRQYLNNVIHNRGEGVMLREPCSVYIKGKSFSLFKVKNMLDADAVVVDIQPNYLTGKLANGDVIYVDKKAKFYVKIGSVITVRAVVTKKLQTTHLHKMIRVRHDIIQHDVQYNQ